ncbi:MAG: DUF3231 family protein [Firmicutes bacterium]|nr:DUF3231 family protein [Bacillota bacterium]
MGFLTRDKFNPMHYGEIFHIWTHLMGSKECVGKFQMLSNHVEDKDLKKIIEDIIENMIKPEIKELDEILKENGIELPPCSQEKPEVEFESIPKGARMEDKDSAYCVYNDLTKNLVNCSQIIGLSIRSDISKIFLDHHQDIARYGSKLLKLMKDKEWLEKPPLHITDNY